MKKTLLLGAFLLGAFFTTNAQILESENFNSLTLGSIGADLTGATAGQGGWYVESGNGDAPTTGNNSNATNFQVVASGQSSTNGLTVTTSNGNKGYRFMYKGAIGTSWLTRTSGNNIIQLEYDFFTGSASTSTTQNGMSVYGLDGTSLRTVAGFSYVPSTKTLYGVAYLKNGAVFGTYLIALGTANTAIVLTDNTWYRIGVAYNTTTGEVIWKGSNFYTGVNAANYAGPFAPAEIVITSATPATNTASAQHTYDNYVATATATENLLNAKEFSNVAKLSVYPNPTNGIVNISNDSNALNSVDVLDLNGRTVKSIKLTGETSAQVNISDLSAGVYMMNISSDQGSVTKKIVKN